MVGCSKCGSALLGSVDNFAVLQLDIVWCYRALEALTCLDDARKRLQRAEDSFLQCYGEHQQRLLMIKVQTRSQKQLDRICCLQITSHVCVVRVTQEERKCCYCGSTCSRVSCPTSKEMMLRPVNNWSKYLPAYLSVCLSACPPVQHHRPHVHSDSSDIFQFFLVFFFYYFLTA